MVQPNHFQKAAFGRHETFALRYGWLTKGFQAFKTVPAVFGSDHATVELGVGKNMVNAIRYWLRATQMLQDCEAGLAATALGNALLSEDGWDPYLEDEATIWLIHWLLATNAELATAWYWFFNCFHKAEFSAEEAAEALADFVRDQLNGSHSEKTVRHEIPLILRMYCPPRLRAQLELDDLLDAPLTSLGLVTPGSNAQNYRSFAEPRPGLPIGVIGFAVNELFNRHNSSTMPIHDLMYGERNGVGIGSVFRLTESALLAKLERLVDAYPNCFQINETAGVNQFFRIDNSITSLSFLQKHYVIMERTSV